MSDAPPHEHRLLLVEDDPDSREALQELLTLEGFIVEAAVSGRDALARLQAGLRPCLILLDLNMPDMDGEDFRRAQQADPSIADIPIAITSADATARERAEALGIDFIMTKPVEPARIYALLDRYCARRTAMGGV